MSDFTLLIEADPAPEVMSVIENGLDAYDLSRAGPIKYAPLTIVARATDGSALGGLRGTLGGGWLYVQSLFVVEEHRGRGLGRSLMERAEGEALRQGHPRVFLNTLSYQSPEFYERMGYTTFAVLEDSPPPHSRVFLRKDLA